MIQNVSMIGTPRTSSATATLAVPEDRQDGQRVADELHAARPGEDRRRVEVPAQEPEQRAGQGEAQDGDERLTDLRRQADEAERDGGDERDRRTTGRRGRRSS